LTEARFAYGHIAGTQMYSREELIKNQHNIVDLVEAKKDQLMSTLNNYFGDKITGTQDSDGRDFMGFGRVMAYDQSCGGIDPTVAGFSYWNPQRGLKPAGTQYALATELRDGMRRLVRLCTYNRESPKVWLMGEDLYNAVQAFQESFMKVSTKDVKNQFNGDLEDFEMFTDNEGRYYIYDAALGAKTGWLINPKRLKIRIHSGTNFVFEPWQFVPGKVAAKSRQLLVYAAVYCKRRNANGYITFT